MADDSSPEQPTFSVVERALRLWRAAHPDATPPEIETTLAARLRGARAALLAEVAADAPDVAARRAEDDWSGGGRAGAPCARRATRRWP